MDQWQALVDQMLRNKGSADPMPQLPGRSDLDQLRSPGRTPTETEMQDMLDPKNASPTNEIDTDLKAEIQRMLDEQKRTGRLNPETLPQLDAMLKEGWIGRPEYDSYLKQHEAVSNGIPQF